MAERIISTRIPDLDNTSVGIVYIVYITNSFGIQQNFFLFGGYKDEKN